MSDRLTELQRQRALIQGHLAWLDQEIAAAAGRSSAAANPSAHPAQPVFPTAASAPADQDAEALLARFGNDTKSTVQSARRGCIFVFSLAFLLLGLGVYGFYLYTRSRH